MLAMRKGLIPFFSVTSGPSDICIHSGRRLVAVNAEVRVNGKYCIA
jgi:hypothetical protein